MINRTTIITGPALVTFAGSTFWSKGDIIVKPVFGKQDIVTSRFGKVDSRYTAKQFDITFEPDGRFTSTLAGILWPYGSTSVGASIYGGSDRALVVHGRDGVKITFHNAALTEMPALRLGVAQTIQGNVKFSALLKNSTDPTDAAAYYTIASQAYPGDTGWAASDILTVAYTNAWGETSPWDDFLTEGGWEIGFALQLAPQSVDGLGVVDMTLQNLDVTARCIPVGPTLADVMGKMGHTAALGSSVQDDADTLEITGAGVEVTLTQAAITDTDGGWGQVRKRLGQTTWTAHRTFTDGAANPLYTIGTGA